MRVTTFVLGLLAGCLLVAGWFRYGGPELFTQMLAEESAAPQQQQAQFTPPPQAVSVVTVQPEDIAVLSELPGRISPLRIAEVRPRVSGIVVERVFTQGAVVEKGDVLYRIDPEPFQVRVDRANAAIEVAEALQIVARQSSERQVELRERNVVSAQAYDDAVANLARTTAAVAVARAELAAAQIDLNHTEVRAPISGRIGRALITEGALVSPTAQESLATIRQFDRVYADVNQPSTIIREFRRAQEMGEMEDLSGPVEVKLIFDNGDIYEHPGEFLFSEATVDTSTGHVMLRGEFPNPQGDLLPGMYVRVLIEEGVEHNALAVPVQAI